MYVKKKKIDKDFIQPVFFSYERTGIEIFTFLNYFSKIHTEHKMSSVKKFYSLPSLYKIGLRGRKEKNFIITSGIDLTNEFIDFNEDSKYKVVGLKYCDWQYSFKPLNLDKIKLYDDITLIKSVLEEKL